MIFIELLEVPYSEYLERLWQLAANNYTYDIKHFPDMNIRFSGKDYTPLDLFYIFTAFEYECETKKEIYNSPDESLVSGVKESVSEILNELLECQCATKEEKDFLKNIKDSIRKQGTEYGQRRKFTNAYDTLSNVFTDSIENILSLHHFEIPKLLSKKKIKDIADFLTTTRGKVAHGSAANNFSDEEAQYIQFFEILTYSMLLKRAELTESEIEMIIGAVFYCNHKIICK